MCNTFAIYFSDICDFWVQESEKLGLLCERKLQASTFSTADPNSDRDQPQRRVPACIFLTYSGTKI